MEHAQQLQQDTFYKCPECLQIMTYEQLVSKEHLDVQHKKINQWDSRRCRTTIFNCKLMDKTFLCPLCDKTYKQIMTNSKGHVKIFKSHAEQSQDYIDLLQFMENVETQGDFKGNFPRKLLQRYSVTQQEYQQHTQQLEQQRIEQQNQQKKYEQEIDHLFKPDILKIENIGVTKKNGIYNKEKYVTIIDQQSVKQAILEVMNINNQQERENIVFIYECLINQLVHQNHFKDFIQVADELKIIHKDIYNHFTHPSDGHHSKLPEGSFIDLTKQEYLQIFPENKDVIFNIHCGLFSYDGYKEIRSRRRDHLQFKKADKVVQIILNKQRIKQSQQIVQMQQQLQILQEEIKLDEEESKEENEQLGIVELVDNECLVLKQEYRQQVSQIKQKTLFKEFIFDKIQKKEYINQKLLYETMEELGCENVVSYMDYIKFIGIQLINSNTWIPEFIVTKDMTSEQRNTLLNYIINKSEGRYIEGRDFVRIQCKTVKQFVQQNYILNHENLQGSEPLIIFSDKSLNNTQLFQLDDKAEIVFFSYIGLNKIKAYRGVNDQLMHTMSTQIITLTLKKQSEKIKEQYQQKMINTIKQHKLEILKNTNQIEEQKRDITNLQENLQQTRLSNYKESCSKMQLRHIQYKESRGYNTFVGQVYMITHKQIDNPKEIQIETLQQFKELCNSLDDIVYVGISIHNERKYHHVSQLKFYNSMLKRELTPVIYDTFTIYYVDILDTEIQLTSIEKQLISCASENMIKRGKFLVNELCNPNPSFYEAQKYIDSEEI